jgi:hypothetical protein
VMNEKTLIINMIRGAIDQIASDLKTVHYEDSAYPGECVVCADRDSSSSTACCAARESASEIDDLCRILGEMCKS